MARYQEFIDSNFNSSSSEETNAKREISRIGITWAEELEDQGQYCLAAEKYLSAAGPSSAYDSYLTLFVRDNVTCSASDARLADDNCCYLCGTQQQAQGQHEAAIRMFSEVSGSSDNFDAAQAAIPAIYYSWAMDLKGQDRGADAIHKYATIVEKYPAWPTADKGDALLKGMGSPSLLPPLEQMLAEKRWQAASWLYQGLQKLYPSSSEAVAARQSFRTALEAYVREVAGGQHAALPDFTATAQPSGGRANVEIRNACPYTLTLLFVGAQVEVLTISPDPEARTYTKLDTIGLYWEPYHYQAASVDLEPGEYSIVAMVGDASISPHYGTDTFQADHSYSSWYYIVTTTVYL